MANIESLHGSDKLREAYPKVNRNFNAIDKEVTDLRSRVNNIITTPIDGQAAAQEVVDARNSAAKSKIFDTLDARLEEIEQDNASVAQVLDAHKADFASYAFGSRPYTATYTELYLDEANGNDNNDGLTQSTAVKTWNKLRSLIPVFLENDFTIKILGGYAGGIISMSSIFSSNRGVPTELIIEGITQNKNNHILSSCLEMSNILVPLTVRHLTIEASTSSLFEACPAITLRDMTVNSSATTTPALQCISGNLYVRESEVNSAGHACILAGALGTVLSRDNTGQGMHGLRAFPGGTIIKYGTQPTGTAANEIVDTGGLIR
jgi:hypothetical protein